MTGRERGDREEGKHDERMEEGQQKHDRHGFLDHFVIALIYKSIHHAVDKKRTRKCRSHTWRE